jgi:undecaprenyl-diphosphatase
MYFTAIINRAVSIDLSLANLLYIIRDPLLIKIFLWVTMLGKWWIAGIITLVVSVIFYFKNHKKYIIPFFISVGASFLTGMAGKLVWHRPRPLEIAVYLEKSWSFPSGHAVLAVSLYGFLIYFFWKQFKRWEIRAGALFLGLLIILLIGFSRLYLGVHYLNDVLAGYMIGLFWLMLSIGLIEHKKNNPD